MVIFFIFVHKNVYRIRFQEIEIRISEGFDKMEFFSLFLMRKRLSGGQKWFLRPYFSLIRGMFVFRSGLRFLFRGETSLRSSFVMITWSEYLFSYLKYLQLTKFISKIRILNKPTIEEEVMLFEGRLLIFILLQ